MILRKWSSVLALVLVALTGANVRAAMMAAYAFEEGSGTTALNSGTLGAAANGTLTSTAASSPTPPSYVPGLYAGSTYGLLFNSTGVNAANQALAQKVMLPGGLDYVRNAPGATLMAWVRMDGATGNNRTIIGINNGDATVGPNDGAARATLQVITNGANLSQVRAIGRKDDTGGSSNATSGTTNLTVGQTYFLAGVFDYLNGGIRVYIDGVQVGSATVAAWNTNSANTANLRAFIGSVASTTAANQEHWPGVIDGARIFNTALTASQILDTYNAEKVPEPTALALLAFGGIALAGGRRRN